MGLIRGHQAVRKRQRDRFGGLAAALVRTQPQANDVWIGHLPYHPQCAAAERTNRNINVENALQPLGPGQWRSGRVLIGAGISRFWLRSHLVLAANVSGCDPDMFDSIRSQSDDLANVAPPMFLDVLSEWPNEPVDAVITANLLHIALPEVLPALVQGAAMVLHLGGWHAGKQFFYHISTNELTKLRSDSVSRSVRAFSDCSNASNRL